MTLQFKSGDWVKLRNGAVERIRSVHPRTLGIQLKDFYLGRHYPSGHFDSEVDTKYDIIAIVDAPETLPEPFELFCNIYPDGKMTSYQDARYPLNCRDAYGKTYRCTVTPIDLVKP